jgi:hypothetical protein
MGEPSRDRRGPRRGADRQDTRTRPWRPPSNHQTVVGLRSRRPGRSARRGDRRQDRLPHLARWRRHRRVRRRRCLEPRHRPRRRRPELRRCPSLCRRLRCRSHHPGRPRRSFRRSRRLSGRRGSRGSRAQWAPAFADYMPAAAEQSPTDHRRLGASGLSILRQDRRSRPISRSRESEAWRPRRTCPAMRSGAQLRSAHRSLHRGDQLLEVVVGVGREAAVVIIVGMAIRAIASIPSSVHARSTGGRDWNPLRWGRCSRSPAAPRRARRGSSASSWSRPAGRPSPVWWPRFPETR